MLAHNNCNTVLYIRNQNHKSLVYEQLYDDAVFVVLYGNLRDILPFALQVFYNCQYLLFDWIMF